MKVLITGPQGSGKTTQAKFLAKFLDVPLVGTGDVLRSMSNEDIAVGKHIKEALNRGQIVDDDIVADIVRKRLSQEDCKNGFVMDGYPRSLHQLKIFDPHFDKVFDLDIEDKQVTKRLMRRGRKDDTPELIKERLRLYHEMTEPLLHYYQKKGILVRVDGRATIAQIQKRIRQEING